MLVSFTPWEDVQKCVFSLILGLEVILPTSRIQLCSRINGSAETKGAE